MSIRESADALAFSEQNRLLIEALRAADWSTPVPTCPGWTLDKLLRHIGRGDRWSALIVERRATEPVDHRSVADGTPPDHAEATLDWLRGGEQLVVNAVELTGGDTPVWSFIGPKPAAWWLRRRLHETLVHRSDVAAALGQPFAVAPELAAASVTEFLEIAAVLIGDQPAGDDPAVTLSATDTDGTWQLPGSGTQQASSEQPAGTTIEARAADLILLLTGRLSLDAPAFRTVGDKGPFERWSAQVSF